jgi:formylmethanofuran dehydrogenase subunit C
MPLSITWNAAGTGTGAVVADELRPDRLAGLDADAVARLALPVGNRVVPLGELARVSGDPGDGHLVVEGDLVALVGLGAGMAAGRLTVRGNVGGRLGVNQSGGAIDCEGDAGPWAGAGMSGGTLRIRGRAGDALGGCLPGARKGMRGGLIVADGDAGDDVGTAMRRGLIVLLAGAGERLGRRLIAGSLFAFGALAGPPGVGMKRGTIALFGPAPALAPGFPLACRDRPPFLALYLRQLHAWGLPVPREAPAVLRHRGDRLDGGQGEILLAD